MVNHKPGDEFQIGRVVYLLLYIGEDKAAAGLQTGDSTFTERRGDGLHSFLQEHIVHLHVRAVVGLLVEKIAELRVRLAFPGTENAVNVEDLLGMGKAEADVAVVEPTFNGLG